MKNSYRKPHTFKKKKSILRKKSFWLGLLAVIFVSGIFYCVYFWDYFQIKNIEMEREVVATRPGIKIVPDGDMSAIRSMVETAADKKMVFLKTKSIFLFNSRLVEEEILTAIPQLETADIKKKLFGQTLSISVSRKEGLAVSLVGDAYFLMDKEGKLFDLADDYDKEGLAFISKPDRSFALGETVLGPERLLQILDIRTRVKGLGIGVVEFVIFAEDKLIVKTAEGWDAYFNLQSDIDWQIVKLNAVLDEKIPEERRGDLEYIELRFGNLAPYMYKD